MRAAGKQREVSMDYSMKLMPQTRSEIDADGSETSTACMPNVLPSGDTTFKLAGRGGGTW